jgi:predicted HicB family RNase H-like nuclease
MEEAMQTTMNWKGYIATIEYDPGIRKFHGIVQNANSLITFYGSSVDELEREFAASMSEYFKICKEKGRQPDKPYSGRFNVRLTPLLHGEIAATAIREGKSLNQWVRETLEQTLHAT